MRARLCGSLQIDMSATTYRLGWQPPLSGRDAIRKPAHEAGD